MAQLCSRCGKSARNSAKFCLGCGTPFAQILQAGMKLDRDRYEVLKPLKSGVMGAVYLLHNSRLERKCVLKEMVPPSHNQGELKEFRERFRNEALTLSKLSHPNLLPVYDHFEENHLRCLTASPFRPDSSLPGWQRESRAMYCLPCIPAELKVMKSGALICQEWRIVCIQRADTA